MNKCFKKANAFTYDKTALYIPNPDARFAKHADEPDYRIAAVLEQNDDNRQWHPCVFFSTKLHGESQKGHR